MSLDRRAGHRPTLNAKSRETVLITGASSGIGLELARCFATDGCRLVLVARNVPALETLAGELRRTNGVEAVVLSADLSRLETPGRIFKELTRQNISVDVLVNNAAFGTWGAFARLPLTRQLEMLQVNITALTEMTGLFLPGMMERRGGGILNVASVAGFLPGPGMAVYYATKAFVLSFTEALAEEVKVTGPVLTVTAVCPGPTETNFGGVARFPDTRGTGVPAMSARAVARLGHRDFRRGKVVAVSGLRNKLLVCGVRLAPRWLVRKMAGKVNRLETAN
ncbi:MAG: SDR family oxidoreductase [Verrucomicrobiota bacterium]|nr:SDR family oxidoreductase [Verrucomicrobiota bacterium]